MHENVISDHKQTSVATALGNFDYISYLYRTYIYTYIYVYIHVCLVWSSSQMPSYERRDETKLTIYATNILIEKGTHIAETEVDTSTLKST